MRHYTVDPRPAELGGGWNLKLLDDNEEAGGGVFPLDAFRLEALVMIQTQKLGMPTDELADALAYEAACIEGDEWAAV